MDAVIRGLAIYFTLLVIIRLSGRRTLAQMTPFDLVIVLVISETTQQAMLGDDFSITNATILILTLFTTDIALSYLKRWSPRATHAIDGVPRCSWSMGGMTSAPREAVVLIKLMSWRQRVTRKGSKS